MKHVLLVFLICIFLATSLVGCDRAQQAIDSIDKAKTFTDDLQKKAKEFIPGSEQKPGDSKKGEAGDKHKEDREDKEEK